LYQVSKIFPTLLHTIDDIPISDECVDYCLSNPDLEEGIIRSNRGGKQSSTTNEDSIIKDLIQKIIDENLQKVCNLRIKLQSYWINVNGPDTYNITHCHPKAVLSGVVYIQASEDSGDVVLRHPNEYCADQECELYNHTDLSQHLAVSLRPKTGVCYIFPGYQMHLVEPNRTQDNRVSVAFNLGVE
tara:strand:+ start:61 stop:618 length:558 start_codon:yes stop_codon:yes gene_type:complete